MPIARPVPPPLPPAPANNAISRLLGSSPADQEFVITGRHKLLPATATLAHLLPLSGFNATAGLNAVIEWCLDRSDVERAHRCLANAARWRIPTFIFVHWHVGSLYHESEQCRRRWPARSGFWTAQPTPCAQGVNTSRSSLCVLLGQPAGHGRLNERSDRGKSTPSATYASLFSTAPATSTACGPTPSAPTRRFSRPHGPGGFFRALASCGRIV
ncbi:hypothetical protein E0198_002289 [Clavispora lusitaniae]|nr:hypothetical protein E0198_002289 [Clavispora lusitaniae]